MGDSLLDSSKLKNRNNKTNNNKNHKSNEERTRNNKGEITNNLIMTIATREKEKKVQRQSSIEQGESEKFQRRIDQD
jgi:hypothetical protein